MYSCCVENVNSYNFFTVVFHIHMMAFFAIYIIRLIRFKARHSTNMGADVLLDGKLSISRRTAGELAEVVSQQTCLHDLLRQKDEIILDLDERLSHVTVGNIGFGSKERYFAHFVWRTLCGVLEYVVNVV